MSPVHDAYSKKGLAPAEHRVAMCELAADASPLIMVDSWEAAQKQYQYSLHVLQHLERAVNDACYPSTGAVPHSQTDTSHDLRATCSYCSQCKNLDGEKQTP